MAWPLRSTDTIHKHEQTAEDQQKHEETKWIQTTLKTPNTILRKIREAIASTK